MQRCQAVQRLASDQFSEITIAARYLVTYCVSLANVEPYYAHPFLVLFVGLKCEMTSSGW
jgi:hypothetical protein